MSKVITMNQTSLREKYNQVRESDKLINKLKFRDELKALHKAKPEVKYIKELLAKVETMLTDHTKEEIKLAKDQLIESKEVANKKLKPLSKSKTQKTTTTKTTTKTQTTATKPSLRQSLKKVGTKLILKPVDKGFDEENAVVSLYIKDYNNVPNDEVIILYSTTQNTCDLIYLRELKGNIWTTKDCGNYKIVLA